jgi:hypothetical protein
LNGEQVPRCVVYVPGCVTVQIDDSDKPAEQVVCVLNAWCLGMYAYTRDDNEQRDDNPHGTPQHRDLQWMTQRGRKTSIGRLDSIGNQSLPRRRRFSTKTFDDDECVRSVH